MAFLKLGRARGYVRDQCGWLSKSMPKSRDQSGRARLTVLDAAHLSNVEQPQAYANAVLNFLLAR
jgi:pimeloyl-ACP methyl ester carboxylesterase